VRTGGWQQYDVDSVYFTLCVGLEHDLGRASKGESGMNLFHNILSESDEK
jgi:hypothetical protein